MKKLSVLKNVVLFISATLALVACSSNDDNIADTKNINLTLNSSYNTRSIDTEAIDGIKSNLNHVKVVLLKNEKAHIVKDLDQEDIAKLNSSEGFTYVKVPQVIDGVFLIVNQIEGTDFAIGTSVDKLAGKLLKTDVLSIQPGTVAENHDNVKNSMMFGYSTNLKTIQNKDNTLIQQTEVTLKPSIARVEIKGGMVVDEDKIKNFHIERIYLDNFIIDNRGDVPTRIQVGQDTEDVLDDHFKLLKPMFNNNGKTFDELTGDNVYAFHVFPQKAEADKAEGENYKNTNLKLVFKVKYDEILKENGQETLIKEGRIEYPTLRLTVASKTNENIIDENLFDINAGNIYKINLSKIDWNRDNKVDKDDKFEPGTGGETPNSKSKDINIIVEVEDYQDVEITPSL